MLESHWLGSPGVASRLITRHNELDTGRAGATTGEAQIQCHSDGWVHVTRQDSSAPESGSCHSAQIVL